MEPVKIGIVGVGGYAKSCLRSIRNMEEAGVMKLAGAVIRSPQKYADDIAELEKEGTPVYASLEEMLEKGKGDLEMVSIPTGIDWHRDQMIQAVEGGVDVVLEKPTAATVQDIDAMQAALDRTGRFCQIGFQSQSNAYVRALKRRICDGELGTIQDVVVRGMWRRSNTYYNRASWAGKLMSGDRYVLDGTINNPMAHYLFNGLYFASQTWGTAATPLSVRAELYRGHEIESEDTSALEVICESGAKVYFYGTLCSPVNTKPTMKVTGDAGSALYVTDEPPILYDKDGKEIERIEDVEQIDNGRTDLFLNAARYLRGEDGELNCPLAMTRAHVLAVNGAFESVKSVNGPVTITEEFLNIHEEQISEESQIFSDLPEAEALIKRAGEERKLFSDLDAPWAKATKAFDLTDYKKFSL
jgi:predicted dehydrogenase